MYNLTTIRPSVKFKINRYSCLAVVDVPRQHGVLGLPLPSARFVSNHVHRNPGPEILEAGITLFLMQWGQFTDHDVVITPILEGIVYSVYRIS